VDEQKMLRNLEWLKKNLAPFGLEWVQLDDGWQGRGQGTGGNRDWFSTCKEKFPKGMKWLADEIHKRGLRPGIWVIPFTQSDEKFYSRNKDLFLHDENGVSAGFAKEPYRNTWNNPQDKPYEWIGAYVLDSTNPRSLEYMKKISRMLCDEWGYDYLKTDGLYNIQKVYTENRKQFHDPAIKADEAYRAGLVAIREEIGKNRFLLNCGQGWDSAGICDGIRTGEDVEGPYASGLDIAVESTLGRLYLNNICFWTDPDVVLVSPPLTLEQARLWVSLVGISGQLLMTGDDMPALKKDRVELLKRILPVADIKPMELYPLTRNASTFDLKINKPGVGEWDVVALFNWNRTWTKKGILSTRPLGIPENKSGFIFYDVWKEKILARGADSIRLTIAPLSCRVVSVRALQDHPQLIGTSRHLTQGADDLERVQWSGKTSTLSGTSRITANDPYRIRFSVPKGYKVLNHKIKVKNGIGLLVLNANENKSVDWKVCFK
jgi:hypothetical protein